MEKSQKIKNLILIIIVILLIFLLGVTVYINAEYKDKRNETISSSTTTTTTTVKIKFSEEDDKIFKTLNYPKENDNSVNYLSTISGLLSESDVNNNFDNITKTKNGLTINYKCIYFGKNENEEKEQCFKIEASIANNLKFEDFTSFYDGSLPPEDDYLFYNNNYIIHIHDSNDLLGTTINIYDRSGTKLKTIENVISVIGKSNSEPRVQNEKLYFIMASENTHIITDIENSDEKINAYYNYIDLSKTNIDIIEVKQIELYHRYELLD